MTAPTTEAEFRALVHAEPHDELAWAVYADWLETRGDELAARVVRAHVALVDLVALASPEMIPAARALLDLAAPLSRAWLDELAAPAARVVGTAWAGHDGEPYFLAFEPAGELRFVRIQPSLRLSRAIFDSNHGAWMQIGRALTFSIQDYSHHDGVVAEPLAWISGTGSNEGAQTWTWRLAALPAGAFAIGEPVPEIPEGAADGPYVAADAAHPLLAARRWL